MTSKRTEYLELAERIADDVYGQFYCCKILKENERHDFYHMFCPHLDGGSKFFYPSFFAWMSDVDGTYKENNEHRIIALLLMHEMTTNI
jgi:hypothetical protein